MVVHFNLLFSQKIAKHVTVKVGGMHPPLRRQNCTLHRSSSIAHHKNVPHHVYRYARCRNASAQALFKCRFKLQKSFFHLLSWLLQNEGQYGDPLRRGSPFFWKWKEWKVKSGKSGKCQRASTFHFSLFTFKGGPMKHKFIFILVAAVFVVAAVD